MASEEETSTHKELKENGTEIDTNADNTDTSDRSKLVLIVFCFEFKFSDLGLIL